MISRLQSCPKWLVQESFAIHYKPKPLHFLVVIQGAGSISFEGTGNSLTEAAKMARKKRDLFNESIQ